ncbi:unnamed protein product [Lactuca saligna]|uniref:Uncharacterized protein n=1 Tax=Lactuca saligna TaxID=75948 RepID=A0AA36ENG9_LACSI|nr:unnamed protein product [Lactuca saligna]
MTALPILILMPFFLLQLSQRLIIFLDGDQGDDSDDNDEDGDKRSESSSSDTRSSDEQVVYPFALLELQADAENFNSKVDNVNTYFESLDSKIDLVLKPLSEIKVATPLEHERANQLDLHIFLLLKHTLEEADERYKENLDHHISTTSTMIKI